MERRVYRVRSMDCAGCERAIRDGMQGVDGVEAVNADARTSTVEVRFDVARVDDERVRGELAELGFPAEDAAIDRRGGGVARYLLLVVATAAVALVGYAGYVLYPRFDLPAVEGAAVLGLAAAAGVASFFSPCSFPLLLGILGRHASARTQETEPAARPVVFGAALAVGAGGFLLLAGLLIAVGGGVLFEQVTFDSPAGITVRGIVGVLLVLLGLVQVGIIPSPFHAVERSARPLLRRQARLRREHPVAGYGLFGFGYVLAGFGWTGPILAGLASYSLAIGGFAVAASAFVVAALTIMVCVFAAAAGVARAEQATLERVEARAPQVKRWTGWLVTGVGVWFLVLAAFANVFAELFPV